LTTSAIGQAGRGERGHQFHFGGLQLAGQHGGPAIVGRSLLAVHGTVQQVADRLDHRIRQADMQLGGIAGKFQRKAHRDHDFGGRRNVGELGVHFRAHVLEGERVNRLPGALVFLEDDAQQAAG
jgi:hypothetical protein